MTLAYFTDDSLLPENMAPLIITAAPYAAPWMPQDAPPGYIPVSWDEQVQAAVDCFNAGARILHIHVRDPKTGHISRNFDEYGYLIGLLRKAVPDMILQLGGSISFTPDAGKSTSTFADVDQRHRMALITPKPDQITVSVGTSLYDLTALHPLDDSWGGSHLDTPEGLHAMVNLVGDATPDFYLQEIKVCVDNGIQPYFALGQISGLELVERLIRRGYYKGPMSGFFSTGGGGICGANPFDLMELVRRTPQGSCWTYQTTFRLTFAISMMMIALGQHTRAGLEDNLFNVKKGERMTSVQMIEKQVSMANEIGRPIATPEEARQMQKIGVSYKTTEETLANLGLPPNREAGQVGFLVLNTDGKLKERVHAGSDGHPLA
ncbi:MAG: 3-keto-5-aminohexanoate cleavage protein [Candidatus Aquilonibacter sp.]